MIKGCVAGLGDEEKRLWKDTPLLAPTPRVQPYTSKSKNNSGGWMMQEIEYVLRLGTDDRYRHRHIREKRKVIFFSVQYETMIENKWHPVVRYDTAHGFAHRDLFTRKGEVIKTPLFVHDYNSALAFAESDLKANWEMYKKDF